MAQEKECPQCAEIVKARARLCRFCGFTFDPGTDLFLDAQYMNFLNNFNATLSEGGAAAAQISADGLIRTYEVLKEVQDGLGSVSPKYTLERQLHHVAWLFQDRCERREDALGIKNADDILLGTPLSRGEFVSYVLEIEDDDDDPDIEGEYDELISRIADKAMGPETLNAWAHERELNSSLGIVLGTVHDGIVEKQGYPVYVKTLAGRRGMLAGYEDSQSCENLLTSEESEFLSDGQSVKVRVRAIWKNGGIVFILLTPLHS